MGKRSSGVSLGDIAEASGTSKATVSYVLRNLPGPSRATRDRIRRIAKQLGYAPDAKVTSWMIRMREARAKELVPIVWLNTNREKNAWKKHKWLSPIWNGANERSAQLGYRLEEIWTYEPGMTMRRISQILYQRGIEGVIVTSPAKHVRLRWDHLAAVSIYGELQAPNLHRVTDNVNFNILLALKSLKRLGYRRIGVCFSNESFRFFHYLLPALFRFFHSTISVSQQVPPLFYATEGGDNSSVMRKQIANWLRRYEPDVVVGHSGHLLSWVEAAGYRVPEEIGVVHIATDDDVADWAGINSNRRAIGATAAELVVSLIQNHQFGLPKVSLQTLISGSWHPGRTLLIPKPKERS